MKQISILTFLILSLMSFSAFAEGSLYEDAIKHTEAAISATDAKGVAQHANEAKMHAQSAKDDKKHQVNNKHLDEAISCLDKAVKEGTNDNIDGAKKSAKEALDHFKAAAR